MDARQYVVVLEPETVGGFSVTVPALPEVVTQGESVDEALVNVREAIELALEVRRDEGEELPPSDVDGARIEKVSVSIPPAA